MTNNCLVYCGQNWWWRRGHGNDDVFPRRMLYFSSIFILCWHIFTSNIRLVCSVYCRCMTMYDCMRTCIVYLMRFFGHPNKLVFLSRKYFFLPLFVANGSLPNQVRQSTLLQLVMCKRSFENKGKNHYIHVSSLVHIPHKRSGLWKLGSAFFHNNNRNKCNTVQLYYVMLSI